MLKIDPFIFLQSIFTHAKGLTKPQALKFINHLLSQQNAQTTLQPFNGRTIKISSGLFQFYATLNSEGFFEEVNTDSQFDIAIEIQPRALLRLATGKNLVAGDITLQGDALMAQQISTVLRNLRWDWEYDVSHHMGDIPTARLASSIQQLANAIQTIANAVHHYTKTTLANNGPWLAREEFNRFKEAVEQLQSRLQQLKF